MGGGVGHPGGGNGSHEEGHSVCLRGWKVSGPHVDLDGGIEQLGNGEFLVPGLAEVEELLLLHSILGMLLGWEGGQKWGERLRPLRDREKKKKTRPCCLPFPRQQWSPTGRTCHPGRNHVLQRSWCPRGTAGFFGSKMPNETCVEYFLKIQGPMLGSPSSTGSQQNPQGNHSGQNPYPA